MTLKGLIIREPWIDEILAGRKTWELRSKPFRHRGEIALIRKGSGLVVGMANMIDCLPSLDEKGLRETAHLHGVPPLLIDDVLEKGWTTPWVLADARRLAAPVPYRHKSGAVITVDLDAEVEREIRRQLRAGPSQHSTWSSGRPMTFEHPEPKPLALGIMSGSERAQALAALPHIDGKSVRSIRDSDVVPKVAGSAEPQAAVASPAIDRPISGLNARRRYRQDLKSAQLFVGSIAAIVTGICFLVWFGRMVVVGLLDTLFTWEGIRWFVWAMIGSVVMGLTAPATDPVRDMRKRA